MNISPEKWTFVYRSFFTSSAFTLVSNIFDFSWKITSTNHFVNYFNKNGIFTVFFVENSKPTKKLCDVGVAFHLYTKKNPYSSQLLKLDSEISVRNSHFLSSKSTIFIIHGWRNKARFESITGIIRECKFWRFKQGKLMALLGPFYFLKFFALGVVAIDSFWKYLECHSCNRRY